MKTCIVNRLTFLFLVAIFSTTSFSLNAQNKGASPTSENPATEIDLEARNEMALDAIAKLSTQEQTAVLSLLSDMNEAASVKSDSSQKSKSNHKKFSDLIDAIQIRFIEIKWMASDGSTFDSREDYLEYQWGVAYPSSTNPYNPFK